MVEYITAELARILSDSEVIIIVHQMMKTCKKNIGMA